MPTIADLCRDPKNRVDARPNYCRIAKTIRRTGPVLLGGAIISEQGEGEDWDLEISIQRAFDEFARNEKSGFVHYDTSKIPPDDVLSRLWGLPLANDVEVEGPVAVPLPAIDGMQARWLCAFCYAMSFSEAYPPGWGRVVRATGFDVETLDACPECVARMDAAGGYNLTPRGAYATGPDQRSKP